VPELPDHLFVVLLLLFPVKGALSYRELKRALVTQPEKRLRWYRRTVMFDWLLVALALGLWFYAARPLTTLGLGLPNPTVSLVGILPALVLGLLLDAYRRMIIRKKQEHGDALNRIRRILPTLPHSAGEMRLYPLVAFSTGVCEEILFRGYLIWYLMNYAGAFYALVVSCIVFGFAHFYQGGKGVIVTAIMGLILGAFYIFTESLWLPIALHAFVNFNIARLGFALVSAHPKAAMPETYGFSKRRK